MFVVEVSPDASMLILYITFDNATCQDFFCNLELERFKDLMVFKESREFNVRHQLFHVDERKANELKHFF